MRKKYQRCQGERRRIAWVNSLVLCFLVFALSLSAGTVAVAQILIDREELRSGGAVAPI